MPTNYEPKKRKLIAKGHMITATITEKEQEVLDAIAVSDYMDGRIDNGTYDFAVDVSFERAGFSGVVGSLVKKGLVWVDKSEGDLCIGFTPLGVLFVHVDSDYIHDYYDEVDRIRDWFLAHDCTMPESFGDMGW